jgi:hypothetical protein
MNGKELIEAGYIQKSRKHRIVVRGPVGKTALEAVFEAAPGVVDQLFEDALRDIEDKCKWLYIQNYATEPPDRLELSKEDFDDFLRAKGRSPITWSKNKCSCGQVWFVNKRCPTCGLPEPSSDVGAPSTPNAQSLPHVDHSEHGRGNDDHGPDDPDCPCRGTLDEKQCADSGCGFCRAASASSLRRQRGE